MRSFVGKVRAISRAAGASAIAAALLAGPAGAQYLNGGPERAPTFDTATHPHYGDPRPGLRALMRDVPTRRAGPQRFCVVGYLTGDGGRLAWIVWREGRRHILWEGWRDPLDRVDSIRRSRRQLDMDTDVVPDRTWNSSTYMIFEHEKRAVEADCAAKGRRYVLAEVRATAGR